MHSARDTNGRPLIEARDICKGFSNEGSRIDILENASFCLAPGETVAVVGASGIGKSTFLHLIGTLDKPDAGALLFDGQDVCRFNPSSLARVRNEFVGFVFQFHHLLPEFTALENTMMPALIGGAGKTEAGETARRILVRVGLESRLGHRVSKLSGGEQQRVALARALVLNPRVLLADEPTGNLDRKNSGQVHELLLELNQEFGMAVVVVTHNAELAALMTRRVTILDGNVVTTQ
jgi:lipoprotein-releasing system ATP-binding protein